MSPRMSQTSVCPSGETSTEDQVASLVVKASRRASGRGLLMSAAGSVFFESFFFESFVDAESWAAADNANPIPMPRVRIDASMDNGFRIRVSFIFFVAVEGESGKRGL